MLHLIEVGALQLGFNDVVAAIPRPTYYVRGSTNRLDVYVIS